MTLAIISSANTPSDQVRHDIHCHQKSAYIKSTGPVAPVTIMRMGVNETFSKIPSKVCMWFPQVLLWFHYVYSIILHPENDHFREFLLQTFALQLKKVFLLA